MAGAQTVTDYIDAVDQARGGDSGGLAGCRRTPEGQWVALGVAGADETRWDVVDFACQKILSTDGDAPLTRGDVEPWTSDGVRAYVSGPSSGDWWGLFRGMLG